MPYVRGYEEDGFLKQLGITRQTLEILSEDKVNRLITIQDSNFKVNSVQEAYCQIVYGSHIKRSIFQTF